jgi:hypothetical protein
MLIQNPHEMNIWAEDTKWRFAKTYVNICPHEYVMRHGLDESEKAAFDSVVYFIGAYGFDAYYGAKKGKYLIWGDYYYWCMGHEGQKPDIINRASLSIYDLVGRHWKWTGKQPLMS